MLGVTYIFYSFRLVLEGKTGKEIHDSSRLEFLEKFFTILLYQMQNTSGPLNRGGIADLSLMSYVRFFFKSQKQSFWEVIDSFCFISICKFGSLKKPFATTTNLSKFPLDLEDLFCWYKQKKRLLWQQHKHLKTMEINEAWLDT